MLIALKRRQLKTSGHQVAWSRTGSALFYLVNPVLLALIAFFKGRTSTRVPGSGEYGWWLIDNALTASVDLTLGAYGFNLPHILWTISTKYWNWSSFFIALTLVVVIAWYLIHVTRTSGEPLPRVTTLTFLVFASALVSGMSYAYLYSYYGVDTGVNNRVAVAAAVGVAISWASLAGLLSRALPRLATASSNHAFCVLIALLCGCGCLINNSISEFWVKASEKQHEILVDMKEDFGTVPPGSSIMLSGLCAWVGPGIIFEADWDTTGALAILYQDDTVKGDLMRSWVKVTEQGIQPKGDTIHSFASLYVYDVRSREVHRISDETTASYYVEKSTRDDVNGCLTSGYGTGLPIW